MTCGCIRVCMCVMRACVLVGEPVARQLLLCVWEIPHRSLGEIAVVSFGLPVRFLFDLFFYTFFPLPPAELVPENSVLDRQKSTQSVLGRKTVDEAFLEASDIHRQTASCQTKAVRVRAKTRPPFFFGLQSLVTGLGPVWVGPARPGPARQVK